MFPVEFRVACLLNAVLELFGSPKELRIYYSSDLVFGFSIDFDWRAWGLYVAGMGIISCGGFKKVDMKDKVYVKII